MTTQRRNEYAHDISNAQQQGIGQQFLSNVGVDTDSLFFRARHLPSKSAASAAAPTDTATAAFRTGFSGGRSSTTAAPPMLTASAGTAATEGPTPTIQPTTDDLAQRIQQSNTSFIQSVLQRQHENIQAMVQSKIKARLQRDFYDTLQSLGHTQVIHRIRVPLSKEEEEDGSSWQLHRLSAYNKDLLQDESLLLQQHLEYFHTASAASTVSARNGAGATTSSGLPVISMANLLHFAKEIIAHEPYSNMVDYLSRLDPTPSHHISPVHSTSHYDGHVQRNCQIALQFLAQQYQSYIIHRVKNSLSQQGQQGGLHMVRGGMMGYIVKYVEMELGKEDVWACAYYALRCGDLDCLLEILQRSRDGVEECVMGYMVEVCSRSRMGKGLERLWMRGADPEEEERMKRWRNSVRELYERLEQRHRSSAVLDSDSAGMGMGGNNINREYQLAVLGLLSFTTVLTGVSSNIQRTSEDYVFLELWKGMESEHECKDRVCDLADNIRHYGPAYFEDGVDPSSNLWVYPMLLFLCQQIRSGLNYLAEKSSEGFCVAVHLGLALFKKGVALTDLSREDSKPGGKSDEYLSMLISAFARGLQSASPPMALHYLIHIPGPIPSGIVTKDGTSLSKNALDKICRLILDTRAFQVLGGTLAGDGSRLANGALDGIFHNGSTGGGGGGTASAVSSILDHAAQCSMREGKMADAAELLSLAGRYADLLSVLNRQLASLLVTDDFQERMFWRQASEQFLQNYLSHGQMYVIQVLEKERQLSLGNTFQTLLNLMTFFDMCQEGKWESAWELVNQLDLLPTHSQEIASKVESFSSLSLPLQNVFHHILSKAMQSLYQQYRQLKSSSVSRMEHPDGSNKSSAGTLQQRLQQLKERARVLTTFAGLVPLHCDIGYKAEIGQLEAYMV